MTEANIETDQLDPDEPHTPLWLTLLGLALFLLAAIFFLATPREEEEPPSPATSAEELPEEGAQHAVPAAGAEED